MKSRFEEVVPDQVLKLWPTVCRAEEPGENGDFQPELQVFLHPDGQRRPAVAICPGGAYIIRAPHEGVDIAVRFRALGFHTFVIQYRVAPYRYPAPQQDVIRAMRLIRAHAAEWNVIPHQIALCGFSAGGHLAASVGTIGNRIEADAGDEADRFSGRPDALILGYTVVSFAPPFGHPGCGDNLLGKDAPQERRAELELHRQVTPDTPPTFLWHTANDEVVPVANALAFAGALAENGVPFGLHVFPVGRHGLGLAERQADVAEWTALAKQFLAEGIGLVFPGKAE